MLCSCPVEHHLFASLVLEKMRRVLLGEEPMISVGYARLLVLPVGLKNVSIFVLEWIVQIGLERTRTVVSGSDGLWNYSGS